MMRWFSLKSYRIRIGYLVASSTFPPIKLVVALAASPLKCCTLSLYFAVRLIGEFVNEYTSTWYIQPPLSKNVTMSFSKLFVGELNLNSFLFKSLSTRYSSLLLEPSRYARWRALFSSFHEKRTLALAGSNPLLPTILSPSANGTPNKVALSAVSVSEIA